MSILDFTKTLLRLELLVERPPSGEVGHGKERILKFHLKFCHVRHSLNVSMISNRVFGDVITTTETNDVTDEHHVS